MGYVLPALPDGRRGRRTGRRVPAAAVRSGAGPGARARARADAAVSAAGELTLARGRRHVRAVNHGASRRTRVRAGAGCGQARRGARRRWVGGLS